MIMAKGQKRGNREDRKPKANKPKPAAAGSSAVAKAFVTPVVLPKKKG